MEFHYRIGRLANDSRSLTKYLTIAFLAGFLAACTPAENDSEKNLERLAILIMLDIGEQPGTNEVDQEALSKTRAEIVSRLKETVPAEAHGSIRTFDNLPAIAVKIDRAEIATILLWPEVKTIELDKTFDLKNTTFK
jgi:hypothetical protein